MHTDNAHLYTLLVRTFVPGDRSNPAMSDHQALHLGRGWVYGTEQPTGTVVIRFKKLSNHAFVWTVQCREDPQQFPVNRTAAGESRVFRKIDQRVLPLVAAEQREPVCCQPNKPGRLPGKGVEASVGAWEHATHRRAEHGDATLPI